VLQEKLEAVRKLSDLEVPNSYKFNLEFLDEHDLCI